MNDFDAIFAIAATTVPLRGGAADYAGARLWLCAPATCLAGAWRSARSSSSGCA